MVLKDRLGHEIHVGDKVAWASKHGSSAVLKVGVVQSIELIDNDNPDWPRYRMKAQIQSGVGKIYTAYKDFRIFSGVSGNKYYQSCSKASDIEVLSIPY